MKTFYDLSTIAGIIGFSIMTTILLCVIVSLPMYFLWNWLMTSIFGLKHITLTEAFGLVIFVNLIFKSNNFYRQNNQIK